eukprot:m.242964 g.242964  ORF g.242964 m.242964 type:complete len:371 (+) comp33805_c3_seq15:1095-2207(+)
MRCPPTFSVSSPTPLISPTPTPLASQTPPTPTPPPPPPPPPPRCRTQPSSVSTPSHRPRHHRHHRHHNGLLHKTRSSKSPKMSTGTGTGTNNFGETNQTKLDVLFSMKRHGEVVKLKVLRKEEEHEEVAHTDPIALHSEVLLRPSVRWRWQKDMTHATPPRQVTVQKVHKPTGDGELWRYDVLDEPGGQMYERLLAKDLLVSNGWSQGKFKRKEVECDVTLHTMPVMQSVRQHQPGATLSYLMVGGLLFINLVWAPMKRRGHRSVALPSVTWQPRVHEDNQQIYLAEIFQHDCNFGYSAATHGGLLARANGIHIKDLKQLKSLISALKEGFLELVTENGTILLDVEQCEKASTQLLKMCNMQNYCSADLR